MKLLVLCLNYAPEEIGIGPCTAGLATGLAVRGHEVAVVAAVPYYPAWHVPDRYRSWLPQRTIEQRVDVTRCPLYVPARPSGGRRVLHHFSFAAMALPSLLRRSRQMRPDVVLTVAPSLIAAPVARLAARLTGAPCWLHVQDLEVEAAFATGLLDESRAAARLALGFERWVLGSMQGVSTISPQMRTRLIAKGVPAERAIELRNWSGSDTVRPLASSSYRAEWGIGDRHVALYSGNIANKQGIELVLAAARLLHARSDLLFVVCGEGPNRQALIDAAAGLGNIQFKPLQPRDRLPELLALATVHLLPQLPGAADLVLPSKLGNMLASGRPIVATASPGTGLAAEADGCGLITAPGDAAAMAAAIVTLVEDRALAEACGRIARQRAEERWSADAILDRFEQALVGVAASRTGTVRVQRARRSGEAR